MGFKGSTITTIYKYRKLIPMGVAIITVLHSPSKGSIGTKALIFLPFGAAWKAVIFSAGMAGLSAVKTFIVEMIQKNREN